MAQKLQWLPDPKDSNSFQGYNRFGEVKAWVTYIEHNYLPDIWRGTLADDYLACIEQENRYSMNAHETKHRVMRQMEDLLPNEQE